MGTQSAIFLFLKENVCSGYSLEAALSSVNDTLYPLQINETTQNILVGT